MDFKFSNDSGDSQLEGATGEKKKQSTLLVLLLILVGGFAYLYFFTGLIKPQEAQKSAVAPAPAPQAVKMPLPAREGEPAKPDVKVPAKVEAPQATVPAPVKAVAPVPAVKPAQPPAKAKEEPQKVAVAKTTVKKPLPVQVAAKNTEKTAPPKVEVKKAAADAKKPVVADKKSSVAKNGVKKPVSENQVKAEPGAIAKKGAPDSWALIVGNYVLEEALSADMGRVRKAGFEPVVKPAARKKTKMSRLFVSDFADRSAAQATLERLRRHTSDAFVMEQGGRFAVYAGSYLQNEAASSEKERLKGAGFTTVIKHADIAIPSQSLAVGPFKNKKAASAALGKLKSAGMKATLSQQ